MDTIHKIVPIEGSFEEEEANTKTNKLSLQKLHEAQISIYGSSTKDQKDAIIEALGGADQILTSLLKSNAIIEQNKLDSLNNIFENPDTTKCITAKSLCLSSRFYQTRQT